MKGGKYNERKDGSLLKGKKNGKYLKRETRTSERTRKSQYNILLRNEIVKENK